MYKFWWCIYWVMIRLDCFVENTKRKVGLYRDYYRKESEVK